MDANISHIDKGTASPATKAVGQEALFKIGRLGKPHGVRGELSFLFDDDVFDRVDADFLFVEIDGLPVPFFIEEYRFRSDDTALMKFDGIDTEDAAAELTGCDVLFPRDMADDNDGAVSKAEIVGYSVIDAATGQPVGTIASVDNSTANLLFEVLPNDATTSAQGETILIPANEDLIKDVDRQGHSITIAIPDGLLSL